MIGQNAIIALRMQGYKPRTCWVNLYDFVPVYPNDRWHPEFQLEQDAHAMVDILPDENVQALDLRFLNGVQVILSDIPYGTQPQRLLALFERIVQFAPNKAAAIVENRFMWFTPQQGVVDLNAHPEDAFA